MSKIFIYKRLLTGHRAFNFVELVVILALISILGFFLLSNAASTIRDQKIRATTASLYMIAKSVNAYYLTAGMSGTLPIIPLEKYPNPLSLLKEKKYLSSIPKDSWDREFMLSVTTDILPSKVGITGTEEIQVFGGRYSFTVSSAGPDRKFGTTDDLDYSETHRNF
ncbi:MAG: type II secretion system protein [Candidatus Wallbacteria bacterium]|nr:type II secretion system protein [Candidatus Wallbacteria bacterium]